MKILEPAITCLVTSHMKPTLRQALESVCCQTRKRDLQVIVVDSGAWFDREDSVAKEMESIYHDYQWNKNIEWYFTGESGDMRNIYCPVAYWTNQVYRLGLIRGKLFCTFYDDDLYYPTFMEKMAGFLETHPEADAVWCSEVRTQLFQGGRVGSAQGCIVANHTILQHENMNCQVDGMQVMIRTSVLDRIRDHFGTDELLPEHPDSCGVSDGLYYNKMIEVIDAVYPIAEVLCEHRHTPYSTYSPTSGD